MGATPCPIPVPLPSHDTSASDEEIHDVLVRYSPRYFCNAGGVL